MSLSSPAAEVASRVVVVAVIAVIVVAVWFTASCLRDLTQAEEVRCLPPRAWAIVILISIPFGGILYLMYGKVR